MDTFVVEGYGCHRDLHVLTHSFPTRRSSDLRRETMPPRRASCRVRHRGHGGSRPPEGRVMFSPSDCGARDCLRDRPVHPQHSARRAPPTDRAAPPAAGGAARRSEEHTSELQSLMRISYAVFCLKKKKQKHKTIQTRSSQTSHIHEQ